MRVFGAFKASYGLKWGVPDADINLNTKYPATYCTRIMRVKVRFNSEASQAPMIVDLRFLPRIGERIELGFRRVIEVLEVRRVENDNRYGGIVRAKFIQEERRVPPPVARPMPMPPMSIPGLAVEPTPAAVAAATEQPKISPHLGQTFGNLNFDELAAAVHGQVSPEASLSNI
jgi:hypothetical protein